MRLTVKMAPTIDRDKLLVRINSGDKPDDIEWYNYVIISAKQKTIVCKLHGDDIPEIKEKRKGSIYVNEPLRGKLGIKNFIGQELDFKINKAPSWLSFWYFICYHPDDIVRVSVWLGIISIALGIISIFITIINR